MAAPQPEHNPIGPELASPRGAARSLARPWAPVRGAIGSFHPRVMPALARANYSRELASAFLLPWALAAVEGGSIGFVVKKLFEGVVAPVTLNYAVAALVAAPALANIASFVWVRFSHGRPKVRFIRALYLSLIGLVGLIAIAPITPAGLVLIVGAALAARMCLAGVVTIRSTVWGNNYARADRARVTGKFTTISVLIMAVAAIGLGEAMEWWEGAFRAFIPVAAVLALLGVRSYARIRVRGERALLAQEKGHGGHERPSLNPLAMRRILRDDRRYDAYMACQNLMGIGNMMSWAPLVILIEEQFRVGYRSGLLIAQAIPLLTMTFFIPAWARLLDRSHIVGFRAIHSWIFAIMTAMLLIAGRADMLWLIFAAAAVKGVGFAGGGLAWNLGHHDFAPPGQGSQYMAIHVTLTGLRGLLAPFLGVSLYQAFEVAQPGAGSWVFLVSTVLIATGAIGFRVLQWSMEREPGRPDHARSDATGPRSG